ncbi:hypothetical protein RKE29_28985 [Streptomyces sp. B1866]|uniref:hypothetical protein n=1 Tax=Streptomyces sp. B1866 TaxID=3075431 RepID=UPI002891551B|nr:hypothetical protein [Streptomyces sp. B1866]MDT3400592.1 hypothetical protein [Streptomyces sp. B1866]
MLCPKPPVCVACADTALRHCPHLTAPVAVRSRKPRPRGVYGDCLLPGPDGRLLRVPSDGYLPYGHRDSRWFLATQLVLELRRCTVVDLAAELGR